MEDPAFIVIPGGGPSFLRRAYELFRIEKRGDRVSKATLAYYDKHIPRFIDCERRGREGGSVDGYKL